MEIETQIEIVLREAGYTTLPWIGGRVPVVCFEDDVVAGFAHVFPSVTDMLSGWRDVQNLSLARHAASLRVGGRKAWNVCCVFLTAGQADAGQSRAAGRIEEDFVTTRKIARADIRSPVELRRALLPLLPLQNSPSLEAIDLRERVRTRSKEMPTTVLEGFIGSATATDVAKMLLSAS